MAAPSADAQMANRHSPSGSAPAPPDPTAAVSAPAASSAASSAADAGGCDGDDTNFFEPSLFLNDEYVLRAFECVPGFDLQLYTLPSASTDFDLTGQISWPGARLLADLAVQQPSRFEGKSVVELGAGLGLAGLACACACRQALLTDGSDVVVDVLQRNVEHNLPRLQQRNGALEAVACQRLDWGNDAHIAASCARVQYDVDVIVGADVCYQLQFIPLLFSTVIQIIALCRARRPHAAPPLFYLAYVERNRRTTTMLLSGAREHGLVVEEINGTRKMVDAGAYEGVVLSLSVSTNETELKDRA